MSFEKDLVAVFEDKVDALSEHHRQMLRRLWEGGRRQGHAEMRSHFDQGRAAGLGELGVFFTKVLKGRAMEQVYFLHGELLEYQPWAQEALQKVLDAPDLDVAAKIAEELGKTSTTELMRRFGQRPPPELKELAQHSQFLEVPWEQASEIQVLESLWDRGDENEMRRALTKKNR